MSKYSFKIRGGKEFIKTVVASNKEEAIEVFSKIKDLKKETFTKLYEVVKR